MDLTTAANRTIIIVVGSNIDSEDLVGNNGEVAFPSVAAVDSGVVDCDRRAQCHTIVEAEGKAAHRGGGIGCQSTERSTAHAKGGI